MKGIKNDDIYIVCYSFQNDTQLIEGFLNELDAVSEARLMNEKWQSKMSGLDLTRARNYPYRVTAVEVR